MKKIIYLSAMMLAVHSAADASHTINFHPKQDCPKITGQSLAAYPEGREFDVGDSIVWRVVRNPVTADRLRREAHTIGALLTPKTLLDHAVQMQDKSRVFCTYGQEGVASSEFVIASSNHQAAAALNRRAAEHDRTTRIPEYQDRLKNSAIDHCPPLADILQGAEWGTLVAAQTFQHDGIFWTVLERSGAAPRDLNDLRASAPKQVMMGLSCTYSNGPSHLVLKQFRSK
jgi:hypothetical protein